MMAVSLSAKAAICIGSLLLLGFPRLALATTYYVAQSSSNTSNCNGATSQANPLNGLYDGVPCLSGGDTLILLPGTYNTPLGEVNAGYHGGRDIPSGSAGSPTVVQAQTIGTVTLQTSNHEAYGVIAHHSGKHHITYRGLVLDGSNSPQSSNLMSAVGAVNAIVFEDMHVRNVAGNGVDVKDETCDSCPVGETMATNVRLTRVTIHHVGLNYNWSPPGAYGLYISGSGHIVENLEIYNTKGWCIHAYAANRRQVNAMTFRNNYLHDCNVTGDNPDGAGAFLMWAHNGTNNRIYNNLMVRSNMDMAAAYLSEGISGGDNVFANNTLANNYGSGPQLIRLGGGTNWKIWGNLFANNPTNAISGSASSIEQNVTTNSPAFVNEAQNNYHLTAGSPAVNQGRDNSAYFTTDIDNVVRIGQWDAGADELGGEGPPPPLPEVGTYHIAPTPTGDDSRTCAEATLYATPKATLASVLPCALGGSTIYLLQGTYTQTLDWRNGVIPPSGPSAAQPTVLASYPGQIATLAPVLSSDSPVVFLKDREHVILQNLRFLGGGTAAAAIMLENTTGVKLLGGEAANTVWSIILMRGGTANQIVGMQVHTHTTYEHCIFLNNANHQSIVRGNVIYDCLGAGIYAVADDYPTNTNDNVLIDGNICHTAHAGATQACIVVGHGSNAVVSNNIVYGAAKGIATSAGPANSTTNAKIYHNTLHANTGDAIRIEAGATGTDIRNNIMWQNGGLLSDGGAGTTQSANLPTDPLFVNQAARNYKLQAISDARNGGITLASVTLDFDGANRPQGACSDIGAYEFNEATGAPGLFLAPRNLTGFMGGR
jgi:hypothetical protein